MLKVAERILDKDLESYEITGSNEDKKEVYLTGNYKNRPTFNFTLRFVQGYPEGVYVAFALS